MGVLIFFQESLLYIPRERCIGAEDVSTNAKFVPRGGNVKEKTGFEDIYAVLDSMKRRYKNLDVKEQEQMGRRILRTAARVIVRILHDKIMIIDAVSIFR